MTRAALIALTLTGCVSLGYHNRDLAAEHQKTVACEEKLEIESRTVDDLKEQERTRFNRKKQAPAPETQIEWK